MVLGVVKNAEQSEMKERTGREATLECVAAKAPKYQDKPAMWRPGGRASKTEARAEARSGDKRGLFRKLEEGPYE